MKKSWIFFAAAGLLLCQKAARVEAPDVVPARLVTHQEYYWVDEVPAPRHTTCYVVYQKDGLDQKDVRGISCVKD